jgi:hypothetical protein
MTREIEIARNDHYANIKFEKGQAASLGGDLAGRYAMVENDLGNFTGNFRAGRRNFTVARFFARIFFSKRN